MGRHGLDVERVCDQNRLGSFVEAVERDARGRARLDTVSQLAYFSMGLLHEIGRDWSLMADPRDFNRMVTERLATLTGASICMMVLFDQRVELAPKLVSGWLGEGG